MAWEYATCLLSSHSRTPAIKRRAHCTILLSHPSGAYPATSALVFHPHLVGDTMAPTSFIKYSATIVYEHERAKELFALDKTEVRNEICKSFDRLRLPHPSWHNLCDPEPEKDRIKMYFYTEDEQTVSRLSLCSHKGLAQCVHIDTFVNGQAGIRGRVRYAAIYQLKKSLSNVSMSRY